MWQICPAHLPVVAGGQGTLLVDILREADQRGDQLVVRLGAAPRKQAQRMRMCMQLSLKQVEALRLFNECLCGSAVTLEQTSPPNFGACCSVAQTLTKDGRNFGPMQD